MHGNETSLILASASPRRLELMSLFGFPFDVIPSLAEETAAGNGREQVMQIARAKCDDVFQRVPHRFVLAADTLVCVDGLSLGKPKDDRDAATMLKKLSGRWHEVHTGCCLRGPNDFLRLSCETTKVEFAELSDEMIERYIRTGEPMDKAGAYAIQGICGIFITRIEGSPSNVIGLPLCLIRQMLEEAGISPLPPVAIMH